jgi:hypothetical protein
MANSLEACSQAQHQLGIRQPTISGGISEVFPHVRPPFALSVPGGAKTGNP